MYLTCSPFLRIATMVPSPTVLADSDINFADNAAVKVGLSSDHGGETLLCVMWNEKEDRAASAPSPIAQSPMWSYPSTDSAPPAVNKWPFPSWSKPQTKNLRLR